MQCFDRLACRTYSEPRPKFTRSLNPKNCVAMAVDQKYIRTLSNVRYG